MLITPQMHAAFVAWCRARGIRRPDTQEQTRVLAARFLAETMQARRQPQQVVGATQEESAEHKINLLRDSGGMLDIADPETEDSDFGEFIRKRAAALEQSDGDDLAAATLQRAGQHADLQQQAPFARTNPPSATGKILGGSATVTPQPIGSPPQLIEVARWQSDDDSEATAVTITLGPAQVVTTQSPGGTTVDKQSRPYAFVQFGTRGFALPAEVDIGLGQQFTIAASFVSLSVGIESLVTPFSAIKTATPVAQTLTGMISFQPIERYGANLTRTLSADIQGGVTTSAIIKCPPFVKSIVGVICGEEIGISPRDVFGRQFGSTRVVGTGTSNIFSTPIALPGGTVDIQVDPIGATFSSTVTLIFGIGL